MRPISTPTTLWNALPSLRRLSLKPGKRGEEFSFVEDEKSSEPSLKTKASEKAPASTQQSPGINDFFESSLAVTRRPSTVQLPVVKGKIDEKCGENGDREEISFDGHIANYFYKIRLFFNSKGAPTQLEHSDKDSTIALSLAEPEENQEPVKTLCHLDALNRLSKAIDHKLAAIDEKLFNTPAEKKVRAKLIELSELIQLTDEIVKRSEAGEKDWVKNLDPKLKGFLLKEEAELTLDKANTLLHTKLQNFATPTAEEKQAFFFKHWNKFLTVATTALSATLSACSWGVGGIISSAAIKMGNEELSDRQKSAKMSNEALVQGCAYCLIHLLDGKNDIVTQLTNSNKAVSSEVAGFLGSILTGLQTGLQTVLIQQDKILETLQDTATRQELDALAVQQEEMGRLIGNALQNGVQDIRADIATLTKQQAEQNLALREGIISDLLTQLKQNASNETLPLESYGQRKRTESYDSKDSGFGKSQRSSRAATPTMSRERDLALELFEHKIDLFKARKSLFGYATNDLRRLLKENPIINLSDESKIEQVLSLIITEWAKDKGTFFSGLKTAIRDAVLPGEASESLYSETESYYRAIQELRASYLEENKSQEEITRELFTLAGINVSAESLANTAPEEAAA